MAASPSYHEDMTLRRWFPILLAIAVLGVVFGMGALRRPLLRAAGQALAVDEPVEAADIVVLPEWAGRAGAIEAADLIRGGVADRVAVLPVAHGPAERELSRRGVAGHDGTTELTELLKALGIVKVETIANAAGGTEAEGQVLPAWCDEHRFRSIVVVSTPDHSRRARRVLHRSMEGHHTKVSIRSTRFSSFDPASWWRTRDGARTEIVELEKLLLDAIRHPIS